MSTYTPLARTNYVSVADSEALREAVSLYDLEIVVQSPTSPKIALLGYNGWPTTHPAGDGDGEVDLLGLIATHLDPGEVLVVIEVGHEKMRYLNGWASAINAAGERVEITLDSIYEMARPLGGGQAVEQAAL